MNIQHAVTLKSSSTAQASSDIVVSQLKDDDTGRMRKQSENEAAIAGYRDGDIDVLINVNILTEGVDLPARSRFS
ncbi:MAG: helicase-related protein [Adlercreutzia equolifaciens]